MDLQLSLSADCCGKCVVQADAASLVDVEVAGEGPVDIGVVDPGDVFAAECGDLDAVAGDELSTALVGEVEGEAVDVVTDVRGVDKRDEGLVGALTLQQDAALIRLEILSLDTARQDLAGGFKADSQQQQVRQRCCPS